MAPEVLCAIANYTKQWCAAHLLFTLPEPESTLLHDATSWEANLQGLQQWLPWPFLFPLRASNGESQQEVRRRKENAVKVSTLLLRDHKETSGYISMKDTAHVRPLWTVDSSLSLSLSLGTTALCQAWGGHRYTIASMGYCTLPCCILKCWPHSCKQILY